VVAKVVKARLADRDAARVLGEPLQLREMSVVEARRLVGMAPDRREHLRVAFGGLQRRAAGHAVRADGQHARDPCGDGRRDELGVVGLADVQVRVAVDHARR
jgi:hypothetical protein